MASKKVENRFNLVDEPWIPVAGKGLVSLRNIFQSDKYGMLGGDPVQKISLLKLMLAICQAVATPINNDEWAKMGAVGMAKKVDAYLNSNLDCFWLYGEKPFLQMPQIVKARKQPLGALLPNISTGNTTVLTQMQIEHILSDAEKAMLIIQIMSFALGGKKTDNTVVLSSNYLGKQKTGRSGPSLGYLGFLHSFLLGRSVRETLWLNLLPETVIIDGSIDGRNYFPKGVGIPPWEKMPKGEDCPVARNLSRSLVGRLVPLSRFVLLDEDEIHYSEGIQYPGHNEGFVDPSMSVDYTGSKPKALWCDPEKRPWRSLTSILSFYSEATFECLQVKVGLQRIQKKTKQVILWSGGLKVSSNAGEQYATGGDNYVESEVSFSCADLGGTWFSNLKHEMKELDRIAKTVYGCTSRYNKLLKVENDKIPAMAANNFWQLCERRFQDLVEACADPSGKDVHKMRPVFAGYCMKVYDSFCFRETARQMDAWAESRPKINWYERSDKSLAEEKAKVI